MDSSPEVSARRAELEREAPIAARSTWMRTRLKGVEVVFLCGTIGAEFDAWQRRLSVTSAADALLSQQIGLDAVEKMMDAGVAYATEQIIDLFANGVNNVHVYTMNRPEIAIRIMLNLHGLVA